MTETRIDAPAGPSRFPIVDAARGAALVAMFVYHFSWDLSYFRLLDVNVASEPGWRLFARLIAGSFLFLVGVSLVLAARAGLDRAAFLRRLALVAGAAAAITLATWLAFPRSFIFFGILHHIAVASVLALPFLRAPLAVVILAAAVTAAMPFLVQSDVFAHPLLLWTGLASKPPVTNDYVPLFPWFGAVLAGVAVTRLALPRLASTRPGAWHPNGPIGRVLTWGGRRSLWIYLIHQPVLLALVWAVAQGVSPNLAAEAESFARTCEASCTASGRPDAECRTFCACAADTLKREGLWERTLGNTLTEEERLKLGEVSAICRAPSEQPVQPRPQ
jgi:uncharacterized membrane protein